VFSRVAKVIVSDGLQSKTHNWLRNVDYGGYLTVRNRILYRPTYWPENSDLLAVVTALPNFRAVALNWDAKQEPLPWGDCVLLEQLAEVSEQLIRG
jgi:hypothetical protein